MLLTIDGRNKIAERIAFRNMFEARKRVFVDLLRWDIPVLQNRYEVDQFDDAAARYILLTDLQRRHLASARLLPTTRPGILTGLFPFLCDGPPPTGPSTMEITRFCLSPDISARERRIRRNQLVTALTHFALEHGITTYTGVADAQWLRQILGFGWSCRRMGGLHSIGRSRLGSLQIEIDGETIARLKAAGVYAGVDDAALSEAA